MSGDFSEVFDSVIGRFFQFDRTIVSEREADLTGDEYVVFFIPHKRTLIEGEVAR